MSEEINNQGTSAPAQVDAAEAISAESVLASDTEVLTESKRKKRWGRTQWIISAAAVLLLGGGGAWAYSAYQSPTTVMGMAIGSLFGQTNPAYDVDVTAGGANLGGSNLDLKMKISTADVGADLNATVNATIAGQPASANVEMVSTKTGDYYVQLSKFDSLLSLMAATGLTPDQLTAVSNAVDGKWVKVSKTEIDQLTAGTGAAATCVQDKFKDKAFADQARSEMTNLAMAHQFMTVGKELGTKDGSVGYEMAFDVTQLKAFLNGAIDSKVYDAIVSCDLPGAASASSKADAHASINKLTDAEVKQAMANTKIEIWADQWSHKLTNLAITTNQNGVELAVSIKPAGERSSSVVVPTKNIVSVSELQNELMAVTLGAQ